MLGLCPPCRTAPYGCGITEKRKDALCVQDKKFINTLLYISQKCIYIRARKYYPYSDNYTHSYNEETGEHFLTLAYKGNPDLTWESPGT